MDRVIAAETTQGVVVDVSNDGIVKLRRADAVDVDQRVDSAEAVDRGACSKVDHHTGCCRIAVLDDIPKTAVDVAAPVNEIVAATAFKRLVANDTADECIGECRAKNKFDVYKCIGSAP